MKRFLWIAGLCVVIAAGFAYVRVDVSAEPTQLTFDVVSRGDVVATVEATGSDVLRQFVAEAMSLSIAGGMMGVLLGIASSYVLRAVLNWTTEVSTIAIAMSFGFSAMVGVVFGYVPARRAAALLPTEALRYE
jgi:ABC-type lipoprotein release transport system permease subunit